MVGIAAVLAAVVPAVPGAAGADDAFPATVHVGGSGPVGGGEELSSPKALNTGKDGRIYVADTGNHRVQVFWENGTFFRQFGSYGSGPGRFSSPRGIITNLRKIFMLRRVGSGRQLWHGGTATVERETDKAAAHAKAARRRAGGRARRRPR